MDEAARRLIAEDARWAGDLLTSVLETSGASRSALSMVLFEHSARVVAEGVDAARKGSMQIGVEHRLVGLPAALHPMTIAARHATKMSEGRRIGQPSVEQLLLDTHRAHRRQFFGRAPRILHPWLADLSVISIGSTHVATSVALQFQLGAAPADAFDDLGPAVSKAAEQQISTLATLAGLAGDQSSLRPRFDLRSAGVGSFRDERLRRLAVARYGRLPLAESMVLLATEGRVNVAFTVLAATAAGAPGPTFRARYLTLVHVLRDLRRLLQRHGGAAPRLSDLASLLTEPSIVRLLADKGASDLRSRLMHYWLRSERLELHDGAPLLGLVEAVYPGRSFEELSEETDRMLGSLQQHLAR